MKQADRERLVGALMHGMERSAPRVRRALEQLASEDVDALEPILDEILDRECALAVEGYLIARGSSHIIQSSPRRERGHIIWPHVLVSPRRRRNGGA